MSNPHTRTGQRRVEESVAGSRCWKKGICGHDLTRFLIHEAGWAWALALQFAVFAPETVQGATAVQLRWPIDPPHVLTSSFGEYRRGHFHGGIDLSTGRKTGLPVHAVADGWVWRVRASGSGYGRALYVRLADDRTAVYAHLEAFNPEITRYVEAAQESLSRYEVDLYPEHGRLPVSAGMVLGRTGESGAGPPHLHFELREGRGADLGTNPLLSGLDWADTTAPVLKAVQFRPQGPGARINGAAASLVVAAMDLGGGRYRIPEVRIEGGALVSIKAWDPTSTGNRLAPQRAAIEVAGRTLYEMQFARFDWNSAHQVELVFDAERAESGDSFFMNLYRPEGALNPAFSPGSPLDGRLSIDALDAGPLTFHIKVSDAAGNAAHLDGSAVLGPAVEEDPVDPPGVFRVARGRAMTLGAGRLLIRAPENAFFGPGRIAFREVTVAAAAGSGLEISGGGVSVDAPDLVLNQSLQVSLAPETIGKERLALYRNNGADSFSWVGNDSTSAGIGGATRRLGTFVLARDVSPPRIEIQKPGAATIESARPAIRVAVTDRGSGFGWSDITTEIDGVTQIVVFDPEAALLSGVSRRSLAPGPHTLVIAVRDRAGNTSKETLTFTVAG